MKDLPVLGIDVCDPKSRGSYTATVYSYEVTYKGCTIKDYGRGPCIEGLSFKDWVEALSTLEFKEFIDLWVRDENLMNVLGGGSDFPTEKWAAIVKINGYDRSFTAPVIHDLVVKVHRNPKPCLI
jgi:hypothetical protein